MATILFSWELGAGMGHIVPFRPVADLLTSRGHTVVAALRDLANADRVFGNTRVSYVQAPCKFFSGSDAIEPPFTFAHILHNVGYSRPSDLRALVSGWETLLDYVCPDLVLADHSPTALLGLRGRRTKRALLGTGFYCPPDIGPLPNLRSWLYVDKDRLFQDEQRVLGVINDVLSDRGHPRLPSIARLFADTDENFLATFKELDHYDRPAASRYYGTWLYQMGEAPSWPTGAGPKVYAYLKPFAALPVLLGFLRHSRTPTLLVADGIDPTLEDRFASETLRFEKQPLDLAQTAQQCDFAILNASHGTTAAMLLAGKPIVALPVSLEHYLVARNIEKLGAGITASVTDPQQIQAALNAVATLPLYAERARAFAARYATVKADEQIRAVVDRIEDLLAG